MLAQAFPILAITPTAVLLGPFDPGGVGTRINTALWVLLGAAGFAAALSRRKSLRGMSPPHSRPWGGWPSILGLRAAPNEAVSRWW
jgi:hypothetical protein